MEIPVVMYAAAVLLPLGALLDPKGSKSHLCYLQPSVA